MRKRANDENIDIPPRNAHRRPKPEKRPKAEAWWVFLAIFRDHIWVFSAKKKREFLLQSKKNSPYVVPKITRNRKENPPGLGFCPFFRIFDPPWTFLGGMSIFSSSASSPICSSNCFPIVRFRVRVIPPDVVIWGTSGHHSVQKVFCQGTFCAADFLNRRLPGQKTFGTADFRNRRLCAQKSLSEPQTSPA